MVARNRIRWFHVRIWLSLDGALVRSGNRYAQFVRTDHRFRRRGINLWVVGRLAQGRLW